MVGFWIFMLIMNLLIPVIMAVFGNQFAKTPPKEINSVFGYRTSISMKNKDTWTFAHHYFGKLWRIIGVIIGTLSIIAMIFMLGREIEIIGMLGGIICGIQIVFMIIPIFLTQKALNANFDKDGNRIL